MTELSLRHVTGVSLLVAFLVGGSAGSSPGTTPVPAGIRIDTVLSVRSGDLLEIDAGEGRLELEGVGGSELRIVGGEGRRGVAIDRSGNRIVVRPRSPDREFGRPLRFEVPRGIDVRIVGEELEIEAWGIEGRFEARVIEGDLRVREIVGDIDLQTVDGEIEAAGVEGSAVCKTVDGDVRLSGTSGALVVAESLDGDLVLEGVRSDDVVASTVDGDIYFQGEVPRGARLRLVTHSGDVEAVIPSGTAADVEVATFAGQFLPRIPVRVGSVQAGRPLRFQLGEGGALIELRAFDGDIVLGHEGRAPRR